MDPFCFSVFAHFCCWLIILYHFDWIRCIPIFFLVPRGPIAARIGLERGQRIGRIGTGRATKTNRYRGG
jgi:hypothetical protein